MKTLVIGYGNPSRNDDRVGWVVVDRLRQRALPDVQLAQQHQLEVDLAESLALVDQVIFVDAGVPELSTPILCSSVGADYQAHAVAHFLTPSDLLALADTLYGRAPRGLMYTIRAQDFEFGDRLSPEVELAVATVVDEIARRLDPCSVPTRAIEEPRHA